MKKIIRDTYFILICVLLCNVCISCNNNAPDFDLDSDSSDDEVVSTILDKASTEWNSSKEQIKNHMKSFQLIDSDEDFLQYSDKNGIITVSYDFANDKLRATVAIVPKLSDTNLTPYLSNYSYFAELSTKKIYCNTNKNTICFTYETNVQDEEYTILGFTPISSSLYDTVDPIIVSTKEVTDISKYSGRISGSVSGVSKSCTCGVRYSTDSNLKSAQKKTVKSQGDFQINITGLSKGTTYYCQCYVVFDGCTYYGEIISFTTLS